MDRGSAEVLAAIVGDRPGHERVWYARVDRRYEPTREPTEHADALGRQVGAGGGRAVERRPDDDLLDRSVRPGEVAARRPPARHQALPFAGRAHPDGHRLLLAAIRAAAEAAG